MSSCDNDKKCYVCKSNNLEQTSLTLPDATSDSNIIICQDCGHATRLEDRDFDTNIQMQIEFGQKTKRPKYRLKWYHSLSLTKSRLSRLVGKRGRVLDIGCGPGIWLSAFGDDWDKYGIDVSSVAAEYAREFANADVFCGPFEEYEPQDNFFDIITAFALIEHLHEPRMLLSWSYRHLRPGGILLLMTGDRESIVAQNFGNDWPLYLPREHLHFFSGRSLHHLVLDAGFKIVRQEWRAMQYQGISRFSIYAARVKDILGLLTRPLYDHLYIYGQKPG